MRGKKEPDTGPRLDPSRLVELHFLTLLAAAGAAELPAARRATG